MMARAFIASVAQMAIKVEATAITEMAKGPSNLQNKSIRRIRAFSTENPSDPHPLHGVPKGTDLVGQQHSLRK